MRAVPSTLNSVVRTFAAPRRAFAEIRDDKPIYLPFMLLLAGAAGVGLAATIEVITVDVTVLPFAIAFLALGALFYAIGVALLLSTLGFVLWVADSVARDGTRFPACLSLAAWASLPLLVSDIASMADVAVGHGAFSELHDFLAIVLYGLEPADGEVTAPPLIVAWAAALIAIGYRQWHAASIGRAAAMALLTLGFHLVTWNSSWWLTYRASDLIRGHLF